MITLNVKREHPNYYAIIDDLDKVLSSLPSGDKKLDTFCFYLEYHLPITSDEEVLEFVEERTEAFAKKRLRELQAHLQAYADNPNPQELERLRVYVQEHTP